MDARLLRKAKALFIDAAALPEDARGSFLDERCGTDDDLRRQVESLLRWDRGPTSEFLQGPGIDLRVTPAVGADDDAGVGMIGRRIEGFTIERFLASGGMGSVYVAAQDRPRRSVALKLMRTGVTSRSALRRFELESQALGRLHHPNIAQVYEAGTYDDGSGGAPYFAMEYVPDARSITAHAKAENLGMRDRLALFTKVCNAVHHGHENGIIHRDLKPSNILVNVSGEPKVIDFGVAKATDSDLAVTTLRTGVGELVGTLQYMSPEQCVGERGDLDARSDVYALGVLLYEMLIGRLPYDLSRVSFFEAPRVIREQPPLRPSAIARTVDRDLETIILKALEKGPGRRYQSATDLERDLDRYLGNEPIEARRGSSLYRARMFVRRNRALVVAVVTVVTILAAATAVSMGFALAARSEAARRGLAETAAVEEREIAVQQAYVANIAAAEAALQLHQYRRLRTHLDRAPALHRGLEWRYMNTRADTSLVTIEQATMVRGLALSPDGQRVATTDSESTVRLWRVDGGPPMRTVRTDSTLTLTIDWSPDGRWVAFATDDGALRLLDANTGASRVLWPAGDPVMDTVAFGPTGARILCGSFDGAIRMLDVPDGRVLWTAAGPSRIQIVAWGGDRVAAATTVGSIYVFEADRGAAVSAWPAHSRALRRLVLSPAGDLVYSCGRDNVSDGPPEATVRVWDAETGALRALLDSGQDDAWTLTISRDGRQLASGHTDHAVRIWDAVTGALDTVIRGHGDVVAGLAFDPTGSRVISCSWDRTIRVWDVREHTAGDLLTGHEGAVHAVAFSHDGRLLASAAADGVCLWDTATQERVTTLRRAGAQARAVACAPGDRRLVTSWSDGGIEVYDMRTGERLDARKEHRRSAGTLACGPDGLLVSGSDDGTAIIWNLDSLDPLHTLEGHGRVIWDVAVSHDETRVATIGRDRTARIWSVSSGEETAVLRGHEHELYAVTFSPDSRLVLTGSRDQTIRVWDAATGELRDTLRGHGEFVSALAYSPDRTRLASASWYGTVTLWDAADFEPLATFSGHDRPIRCLAFSRDGDGFATGSEDTTVRLWDVRPRARRRSERGTALARRGEAERLIDELLTKWEDPDRVADAIEAEPSLDPALRGIALNVLLSRCTGPPTSGD